MFVLRLLNFPLQFLFNFPDFGFCFSRFGFDGGTDKALREGSESKSSSEEISSSKSHSSSLTSDNDSSKEIRAAHNLRIVAVVARCHEMKFKV